MPMLELTIVGVATGIDTLHKIIEIIYRGSVT